MERSILYLILCLSCFYLIFDDLFGKKRVSLIVTMVGLPDLPSLQEIGQAIKDGLFGGGGHKQGDYDIKPTQPGTPKHDAPTPPGVFDPNKPQGGT